MHDQGNNETTQSSAVHRWPYDATLLTDGPLVLERMNAHADFAGLFHALADARVWAHIPNGLPANEGELAERMRGRITRGGISWLIALDDEPIGTSSFIPNPDDPESVEIGATYLAPSRWGTGVNSRVKRLMIDVAFSSGASWIQLRTDERNARSAAAIAKLGAVPVGTLQEDWIRPDGSRRTSLMFRLDRPETQ